MINIFISNEFITVINVIPRNIDQVFTSLDIPLRTPDVSILFESSGDEERSGTVQLQRVEPTFILFTLLPTSSFLKNLSILGPIFS